MNVVFEQLREICSVYIKYQKDKHIHTLVSMERTSSVAEDSAKTRKREDMNRLLLDGATKLLYSEWK